MPQIDTQTPPPEPAGMQSADPRINKALRSLLGLPETRGYKPVDHRYFLRPRDLPPFTFNVIEAMQYEPTIKLGLAARAAPLCTPEFAYKQGDKWIPGIQAENEIIAAYVERQLLKIWNQIDVLLDAQRWGWAAAEITYEVTHYGTVEVLDLLPRHARDTRIIKFQGQPVGARFLNVQMADEGMVDCFFPNCVFHNHALGAGEDYGTSILIGAYSPWADKWLHGGALDVRRLFMHKDAYGGADLAYPEGTTIIGDQEVPNRDIAREVVEQLQAGGVTSFPSKNDANGNPLWKLTRATVPANPTHILQFPKDLDTEILRGLEVPDDVLSSDNSGAWAGKQVPMAAFYNSLDRWLASLVRDVVRQVLRPLVRMNFGGGRWFEVSTKPLAVQALEQQSKAGPAKSPDGGGGMPFAGDDGMADDSMGNDEYGGGADDSMVMERAVGMGLLRAASTIRRARSIVRRVHAVPPQALSVDSQGNEHAPAGSEKGGQFVGNDQEKGNGDESPSVVEFKGNEFDLQADNKTLRREVYEYAKSNLAGKKFVNLHTKREIQVSMKGIEKAIANLTDRRRALAIAKLPELLASAQYQSSALPDMKPGHTAKGSNVRMFHVFNVAVNIANQKSRGRLIVREDNNGDWFYSHDYEDAQ
ncbi:MAG: hypothetical protein SFX18_13325 [Pirellulales bacterium]|nr:hypothetical protein [Pirellulales bacterium]